MSAATKTASVRNVSLPLWYQIYFDAMQERDRSKALPRIERAQDAIRKRRVQLLAAAPSSPRESQDLDYAAVYLGILLQHLPNQSGDLLWD